MAKKNTTPPARSTGRRAKSPPSLGPKYALAGQVLGMDPIKWIKSLRPLPFRTIADSLNDQLAERGITETVTWESVRAWYRTKYVKG